ncbi:restriction endonuclease subunit S [Virgibacillus kimchii]
MVSELNKGPFDLGELPSDWKIKYISNITKEHKQGYYTKDEYSHSGVKLIRVTDLLNQKIEFDNMPSLNIDEKTYNQFKVDDGDFLFARSGGIGRYGIFKYQYPKSIFGSYLIRFKFDTSTVDNKFVGYFYESYLAKKQIKAITQGSSNININAENIKSLRLPIPMLKEQQKIATILSSVDEAIEKTEQIIEQTETVKKGLMEQLLTKGIGHTKFKNTPIGKIPHSWETAIFSDYINVNPRYNLPKDTELPFVEMAAVPEKNKNITYFQMRKVGNGGGSKFTNGDTLFARITPCTENGKTAFVQGMNFEFGLGSTEFIVFSSNSPKILPEFIYYLTRSERIRNYAISQMTGSTGRQRVPVTVFTEKLLIAIPPIEEQQKIINVISSNEIKVEKERTKLDKLSKVKNGLMQQLLTGKVRVPINDNEEVPS